MKQQPFWKTYFSYTAITATLLVSGQLLAWLVTSDENRKIAYIQAGPVVFIGIATLVIAFQQYRTSRAKLNLDLFNKRYLLFKLTWKELSRNDESPISRKFTNSIPKSEFLFGKEMYDYLLEIANKRRDVLDFIERQKAGFPPTNEELNERLEIKKWLLDERNEGALSKFGKYMDFENWK